MKVKEKEITLKDGRKITLRSLEEKDAQSTINFLVQQNSESYFMISYPEEIAVKDVEDEKSWILNTNASEKGFTIAAIDGDRVVGNSGVDGSSRIKLRHRGTLGIGILKEYWNSGLGSAMMNYLIETAESLGYEQIELTVYEDNTRAFHVYQKYGFKVYGCIPRAFKLKDGTYRDAIEMALDLRK